jgi:serine/threonine-protein kinase
VSNLLPPIANGRYTLSTTLGKGGMATVYGGFDTMLEVERAVKVLSPTLCSNDKVQKRFMAEARAMAKLRHPNIVTIFDVGIDGETPYIVMEKVDGGAVIDWLDHHGPQSPDVAGHIILGVLAGLQASHDRGIVHRDIKPHNMLLTRDGLVKITDYGIANVAEDERSFTKTGTVMGTLAYMPPEQRVSAKGVGPTADIFATGASLFAILTTKEPFDLYNESLFEQLYDGIPGAIQSVIMKACHYDPTSRYQSANAMTVALKRALTELDIPIAQNFQISMDGSPRPDGTQYFDGTDLPPLALAAPENTTINPNETWLGQEVANDPPGLTGFGTVDDDHTPTRSARPLAIGVAVAVALAGVFVIFQPDQPAPEPVLVLPTVVDVAPKAAEQAPAPAEPVQPEPVQPGSEPKTEVAPAPVKTPAPRASTQTQSRQVPKKSPPPLNIEKPVEVKTKPLPAPKAPAEPGTLSVRVIPPSDIAIDGKRVGFGSVRKHSLTAGPHTVVLSNKDGRVKSTTINISAGKPSTLCWSLEIDDFCPR